MKKRIICLLISICMIFGLTPALAYSSVNVYSFEDMLESYANGDAVTVNAGDIISVASTTGTYNDTTYNKNIYFYIAPEDYSAVNYENGTFHIYNTGNGVSLAYKSISTGNFTMPNSDSGWTASRGVEADSFEIDYVTVSSKNNLLVVFKAIPTQYQITCNNGTADKTKAEENEVITVTADSAPSGKQFKEWTGCDSFTFTGDTDKTSSVVKFIMPASDVELTATYEDLPSYSITVNEGTADKEKALEDEVVTITADSAPSGKQFKEWTGCDGLSFTDDTDKTSSVAKLIMPATSVELTATYEDLPSYSITVNQGTSNKDKAKEDEVVTITADTALSGKQFKEWTGCDGLTFADDTDKTSSEAKFIMPASSVELTATFEDMPSYSITVSDGTANKDEAQWGDIVTVSASTAPNGMVFKEWTGCDNLTFTDGTNSTDQFAKFIMPSSDVELTATYEELPSYSITVNEGTVDKTNAQWGEIVTIAANTAPSGKQFKEWTGCDNLTFTDNTNKTDQLAKFIMPASAVSLTATYEDIPTYSVTVNQGTADKTNAEWGQVVTITADTAPSGKQFKEWTGCDDISFTEGTNKTNQFAKFIMPNSSVTLTAIYEDLSENSVSVDGGTTNKTNAQWGDVVTIIAATAPSGKQFKEWTGCDELAFTDGTNKTSQFARFIMPDSAVTLTATYEDVSKYSISVNEGTADKANAQWGEVVTITASTAPAGKHFKEWVGCDDLAFSDGTNKEDQFAKFIMPNYAVILTATYEDDTDSGTATTTTDETSTSTTSTNSTATATTDETSTSTTSNNSTTTTTTDETNTSTTSSNNSTVTITSVQPNIFSITSSNNGSMITIPEQPKISSTSSTYNFTYGEDQSIDLAEKGLVIAAEGDFDALVAVRVDSALLDDRNYTVIKKNKIIILNSRFIEKLSPGDHTVTLDFLNQDLTTNFTITKKNMEKKDILESHNQNNQNDTQSSNTPYLVGLLVLILVSLLVVKFIKIRKNNI